ncbi:MAG: hypothetical protein J3K34DRAFT_436047 [Monoraphidium minutum]|nr:MAG: hypothetical protein J3K34DRAFT_436047 [Monoraphidium minutum]
MCLWWFPKAARVMCLPQRCSARRAPCGAVRCRGAANTANHILYWLRGIPLESRTAARGNPGARVVGVRLFVLALNRLPSLLHSWMADVTPQRQLGIDAAARGLTFLETRLQFRPASRWRPRLAAPPGLAPGGRLKPQ